MFIIQTVYGTELIINYENIKSYVMIAALRIEDKVPFIM